MRVVLVRAIIPRFPVSVTALVARPSLSCEIRGPTGLVEVAEGRKPSGVAVKLVDRPDGLRPSDTTKCRHHPTATGLNITTD